MRSEPYAEVEEDNQKVGKLTTLCAALKTEIGEWKAFRSSTLNRLRVGTKVAEVTHEHEVQTMLRFFGYLHTVVEIREPTMKKIFCNHGVGMIVEDYARWLEAKQLKWSSVANYLAALVSAATFATVEMETPPPLDQLANLRRQAEKMAREETLYRKKAANWIDWADVQKTRVAVIKAYNDAPRAQKAGILKDVVRSGASRHFPLPTLTEPPVPLAGHHPAPQRDATRSRWVCTFGSPSPPCLC